MPDITDARTELAAMRKLLTLLEPLDADARRRVWQWIRNAEGAPGGGDGWLPLAMLAALVERDQLGGRPVPSQGQDITEDQLDALVDAIEVRRPNTGRAAYAQDRLVALAKTAAIQGYRVGYAAALGYEITVTDAGVQIGDRVQPDRPLCEVCEQPIQSGEPCEELPGTGGLVAHVDHHPELAAGPAVERPVDLVDKPVLPDVWAGLRGRVTGQEPT